MSLSSDPVTRSWESGEKHRDLTGMAWPGKWNWFDIMSHIHCNNQVNKNKRLSWTLDITIAFAKLAS